jgi:hypothetical protein
MVCGSSSTRGIVSINQEAHVVKNAHDTTRRFRRLIAAAGSCLVSAIIVATQIPQIRDTVGITQTAYGFIHSTVPSIGVAAVWIGFALMLAGAAGMRQLYRVRANDAGRRVAVGAAVLVVAVGGLVAIESSFEQSTARVPGTNDVAQVIVKDHRSPRRRPRRPADHSPKGGHRSNPPASPTTVAPSTPTASPTTASPTSATAPAPTTTTPAPSPPPAKPNNGSSGSSSSGSGGNNNTVTVNKNNNQEASSGNATGENARSGEAKNENNEGPVSISIG